MRTKIVFLMLLLFCFYTKIFSQQITAAEYFWDVDPGPGNATALVAIDGNFNQSVETALANTTSLPSNGEHVFCIRFRDHVNNWGPVFKTVIDVWPNVSTVRDIKVTSSECFWDADPGTGNGTAMIAFDGNFDQSIETVLKSGFTIPVTQGIHIFNVRLRDAANNWGPVFKTVIDVWPNVSFVRDVKVTLAEYYFDSDPGAGNATPMLSFDGNFDSAVELIKGGSIPSPVSQGVHALYMRLRDAQNNWGPAFGIVVNVDTNINAVNVSIAGTNVLCDNNLSNQIYTSPLNPGYTYNWIIGNGTIVNGQGTNSVTVNWNQFSNGTLKLVECNGALCDSDEIIITINPTHHIYADYYMCDGDSMFVGGAWQTTAGIYIENYSTVLGCDSIIETTLVVYPDYQVINNESICQGDSINIGGSWFSTPGTYQYGGTTQWGCDSSVTVVLTVNPVYLVHDSAWVNTGDSIFVGGAWQTTAGNYYDLLQSVSGCDSLIITTVIFITGLTEIHSNVSINIFPNPAKDVVRIVYINLDKSKTELMLTDATGRIVLKEIIKGENGSLDFDVKHLPQGLYHCAIRNATAIYAFDKLLIIH